MARQTGRIASIVAALTIAFLGACTPIVRNHGYVPLEEDLALLTVGVDTRETVAATVGAPGASGVIDSGGYYYVRSRWETVAWRAPKEVERQLVAVSFDEDGVVENIERFGLEDGRVVPLSRRVTRTTIRNISFIRQLLGSFGRLTADQLLE
jgi:outer membrane protein assembly factor BamE (lipoprotein component of BamABCDE complex)